MRLLLKTGLFLTTGLLLFISFLLCDPSEEILEEGIYSIYYGGEKVGYEEYAWKAEGVTFVLQVKGRMDGPVPSILDELLIRLDRNFIPVSYVFKGMIGGIPQQVDCTFEDGTVDLRMMVAGRSNRRTVHIQRDAFLLPNPFFSPYLIIAKKFGCRLEAKQDLFSYIVPQLEDGFSLESDGENPCLLILMFKETRIEMDTDENGMLLQLRIPSQNIRVVRN
ncbi:MAG: hypothetical protein MUP70_05960 [Candidatus Aminicenantes bacterium]|nr:hypothetical protein [Candidatus Aminicenantes bacterium]